MNYIYTITIAFVFSLNAFCGELGLSGKRFGTKITFEKGTTLISFGVGPISPFYATNSKILIPPVSGTFEYGITDRIGLGLLAGYAASKLDGPASLYEISYSYIVVQARFIYHLVHRDKLDIYAGAGVQYGIASAKWNNTSNSIFPDGYDPIGSSASSKILPAVFFGGRYYLSKSLALFGEVGYSISYATLGITFRLQ